jgi:hypothetical protein
VDRWINANPHGFELLSGYDVVPGPGDVVLAEIEKIGQHNRIELPDSRRASLFLGDEIVVAYGHRYAPDQFEAQIPTGLNRTQLVAAGGLAGDMLSRHAQIKDATVIRPVGLLHRDGEVVNLASTAPFRPGPTPAGSRAPVVTVVGTSMNSGKSTTVAALVRGLRASGLTVTAGKVTGTGAGNDVRLFYDAGAARVLDFTDFGFGSTYQVPAEMLRALLAGLVEQLAGSAADVTVLEIADGVFQQETVMLLSDPVLPDYVDAIVFCAADAAGAYAGLRLLADRGLDVLAVSGVVTASPLATREAAAAVGVPVVFTEDLADPVTVSGLTAGLMRQRLAAGSSDEAIG